MKTIAEHAKDVLSENGVNGVMYGDSHLLEDIASRAGVRTKVKHPLNRWKAVLAGLERSPDFEKFYVTIHTTHNRPRAVRSFRLKGAA